MREDQELACDAYALTFIDKEEQIAYGHTIITLLEHYSYQAPSLASLSRNKRTLKRRIVMIKSSKEIVSSFFTWDYCYSCYCIPFFIQRTYNGRKRKARG